MFINVLVSSSAWIILAVIVGVLLIGAGVFLYLFFSSRIKIKNKVKNLKNQYINIHEKLNNSLHNDLDRIHAIAKLNIEYESVFNSTTALYQSILKNEDKTVSDKINFIENFVNQKEFKAAKDELEDTENSLQELIKRVQTLENSIMEVLSLDDQNRADFILYQKKFREYRDFCEHNRFALQHVESSLTSLFDKINDCFSSVNSLFDRAYYDNAKVELDEIKKAVDSLGKFLNPLPQLVPAAFVTIPNALKELKEEYDSLVKQGYPLHQLLFQQKVDNLENIVKSVQTRLNGFVLKNCEKDLTMVKNEITNFKNEFSDEIRAKSDFIDSFEMLYRKSTQLENRFIKLRRFVPGYKSTYVLKDECLQNLETIQIEINDLDDIKRNLDTFIHANSQQAYSLLNAKLLNLKDACEKIELDLDNVQEYLSSLKQDSENAYQYISEAYLRLKQYQSLLRKINVKNLILNYRNNFSKCFEIIDNIGKLIKVTPIDVAAINEYLELLKEEDNKLEKSLYRIEEKVKQAEEAIVQANQYRLKFIDIRNTLSIAEQAFFEGDFSRTSLETSSILKQYLAEGK